VGVVNAAAPLMGLLALLGLNWLFTILFIDAIIAPLGTTNVYIAVTARILYSLAKAIRPLSRLTHKNVNNSPVVALWVNGLIGVVFLFPFPTWKELVNFLSSIVVFAYLAGPISLLVIHSKKHDLTTNFNVPFPKLVGYAAFVCCSWLIYWSGLANLGYLMITLIVSQIIYCIFASEITGIFQKFKHNWYVFAYVGVLWLISYLHEHHKISFPHDNVLIAIIGIIFCYIFVFNRLPHKLIKKNIITLYEERLIDNYLH
jgi:amino acid transporter